MNCPICKQTLEWTSGNIEGRLYMCNNCDISVYFMVCGKKGHESHIFCGEPECAENTCKECAKECAKIDANGEWFCKECE